MRKNNISIKEPKKNKWDYFLEDLVNNGIDFSFENSGNSIRLMLPSDTTYSVLLHRDGRYDLE